MGSASTPPSSWHPARPATQDTHPENRRLLRGPLLPTRTGRRPDLRTRHSPTAAGPHVHVGLPTCWDEWFPEVARAYALAGAEILAYPTAIGSEPDHPDFDTAPLWQTVIVAKGISNGTFMTVPNRRGDEGLITFYGSSFISDPYGRILAQAPRTGDSAGARSWAGGPDSVLPGSTSVAAFTREHPQVADLMVTFALLLDAVADDGEP
jgi:hypothetical protein